MLEKWGDTSVRYKAAGKLITSLMDSIFHVNENVEFSLRAFGHQYPAQEKNCYDTKREVMFSKDNRTQMSLRLADLTPRGVTPIAYSLQEAAENDLEEEDKYAYSILLITDGGESCGGDICEVVKKLLAKKIYFKPYIVSLVDNPELKTEYACLGNYLQVTNEHNIPNTIDTIINAFRPALVLTTTEYARFLETNILPPSALQIRIPAVNVQTKVTEPIQKADITTIKTQEPVKTINNTNPIIKTIQQQPNTERTVKVPAVDTIETFRNTENIFVINPVRATSFVFPIVITTRPYTKVKVPEIVKLKSEPAPITRIPNSGGTIRTDITPKDAKFTTKIEDSKETTVQIYFTNGKGKFYSTTPQLILTNPSTGKEVKKFYRTIDAANNPDPINIAPGTYDLSVVNGKTSAHNIVVQANKSNKIFIEVHNGSLRFYYSGNKNRPVTEFEAVVTHREIGGTEIRQKCTQVLEYESGSYHITINTLPVTEIYTDLEFESELQVPIEEPGWIQFTNTNKIGKVSLYTILGDQFLRFYTMDVNGFPESQKLRLKPGSYKAHFIKYPGTPSHEEMVMDFRVESNATTELELKVK
jgi:hypothetical protein